MDIKERLSFGDWFYIVILFLLAIVNADPRFLLFGVDVAAYFVLHFFVTIFMWARNQRSFLIKGEYILRLSIVFLLFLVPLVFGSHTYANRYLHLSGMLLFFMIFDMEKKKSIFKYVTIMLIIWSLIVAVPTFLICSVQPYASRQADVLTEYMMQGVGGYMFIYAIALGSVLIFAYLINAKKLKFRKKVSLVAVLLVYILTIYQSNFMTAVIISLLGILVSFLFKDMSSRSRFVYMGLLLILFLVVFPFSTEFINLFIQKLIPDSGRISNIFQGNSSVFGGLVQEFVRDRLPTMRESLDVIAEYPVTGIFSDESIWFGQHSTILDTLAIWGIPMGIIYLALSLKPFFLIRYRKNVAINIPIFVSFFVFSLFNNVEPTSLFVIFVIAFYVNSLCVQKT